MIRNIRLLHYGIFVVFVCLFQKKQVDRQLRAYYVCRCVIIMKIYQKDSRILFDIFVFCVF
jgi:hypothetical protein